MEAWIAERLGGMCRITAGRSRPSLAAASALSLPRILVWLGTQVKVTEILFSRRLFRSFRIDVIICLLSLMSVLCNASSDDRESVIKFTCVARVVWTCLSAAIMAASSVCRVQEPLGRRKEAVSVLQTKAQAAVWALGSTEPSVK